MSSEIIKRHLENGVPLDWTWRAMYEPCGFGIRVQAYAKDPSGDGAFVLGPPTMEKVPIGSNILGSGFNLELDQAIKLMNGLWNCGIRPTENEGGISQVEAMRDQIVSLKDEIKFLRSKVK